MMLSSLFIVKVRTQLQCSLCTEKEEFAVSNVCKLIQDNTSCSIIFVACCDINNIFVYLKAFIDGDSQFFQTLSKHG